MLQSFKLALKAIFANKMRSFLTMLGIIIGVSAVIILVSIVSGYTNQIVESFESMGANRISCNLRNSNTRFVTDTEMYKFYDEHSNLVNGLSPYVMANNARVKFGNENSSDTMVYGVSEDYSRIAQYDIVSGRNLLYADIAGRASTCVIGAYVSYKYFKNDEEALENSIKVNGRPFKIVGVLEAKDENNFEDGCQDDLVWIPYTVACKMTRTGRISQFLFNSVDTAFSDQIVKLLQEKFYSIFKDDTYYNVNAQSSIIKELNSQVGRLSAMLGGIAGISLLVAGIGVMNIMLVSVTERTREIGIRKALGARQGVILQQFIIEAAVTSSFGGVIGIILGGAFSTFAGKILDINSAPTLWAVLLSFGVSVAIGLIFGYVPAKNAAKLNPIDALRDNN